MNLNSKVHSVPKLLPNSKNVSDSVGVKIKGDFDGDGKVETATVILIKKGKGNPVEDGTPDQYEVKFSGNIKPLPIGCCEAILVNEGALGNKGGDKLSILQAPLEDDIYSMSTYAYIKGRWIKVIDNFLISNEENNITDRIIQSLVFEKNGTVYINEQDMNSDTLTFVKKAVKLKMR